MSWTTHAIGMPAGLRTVAATSSRLGIAVGWEAGRATAGPRPGVVSGAPVDHDGHVRTTGGFAWEAWPPLGRALSAARLRPRFGLSERRRVDGVGADRRLNALPPASG